MGLEHVIWKRQWGWSARFEMGNGVEAHHLQRANGIRARDLKETIVGGVRDLK